MEMGLVSIFFSFFLYLFSGVTLPPKYLLTLESRDDQSLNIRFKFMCVLYAYPIFTSLVVKCLSFFRFIHYWGTTNTHLVWRPEHHQCFSQQNSTNNLFFYVVFVLKLAIFTKVEQKRSHKVGTLVAQSILSHQESKLLVVR